MKTLTQLNICESIIHNGATITKVSQDKPMGQYEQTHTDYRKQTADFLIKYVNDGKFTIAVQNKNLEPKGRGVKDFTDGSYIITKTVLDKLKLRWSWMVDF